MNLTAHQLSILRVLANADADGEVADLDQVIERVDYDTNKAAIQFTIRSLIKRDLIMKVGSEKRRGRRRTLLGINELGKHYANLNLRPAPTPAYVSSSWDEEFLSDALGSDLG